jgi:hypothetical protein
MFLFLLMYMLFLCVLWNFVLIFFVVVHVIYGTEPFHKSFDIWSGSKEEKNISSNWLTILWAYIHHTNRTDKTTTTTMKSWLIAFFFRSKYIKRERKRCSSLVAKIRRQRARIYIYICIYWTEEKRRKMKRGRHTFIFFCVQ